MELARYVVDAVVLEGRGVREVARSHGVSKTWVSVQLARYREGGYEALAPRSRRAHSRPNRTPDDVEDEIVRLRKKLAEKPSLEVRQRIKQILSKLESSSPERLREVRAIQILEYAGTAEAKECLRTWAKNVAYARLTREAEAALERLAKR